MAHTSEEFALRPVRSVGLLTGDARRLLRQPAFDDLVLAVPEGGAKGLVRLLESPVGHLERPEGLLEELTRGAHPADRIVRLAGSRQHRRQGPLEVGGQLEQANAPAHRVSRELVGPKQRGLLGAGPVLPYGGCDVLRPEVGGLPHAASPQYRATSASASSRP